MKRTSVAALKQVLDDYYDYQNRWILNKESDSPGCERFELDIEQALQAKDLYDKAMLTLALTLSVEDLS